MIVDLLLHTNSSDTKICVGKTVHFCDPDVYILCLGQDKVLSNKTPKLDRSDGVKEMKEKAPKRKLPFTTGANGDQKDSDSGRKTLQ